jgi:hypothetical protein
MNCFYDCLPYKKSCRLAGAKRVRFWPAMPALLAFVLIFPSAPSLCAQAALPKIEIAPPASFTKGTPNYQMRFHTTSSGVPGAGGGQRMAHLDLRAQPGPAGGAAPKAWHMIPPGMQLGEYLPLIPQPQSQPTPPYSGREDYKPEKMIVKTYWGCGDTVRQGQPNVMDTGKFSAKDLPDMSGFSPKGRMGGGAKGGPNTVLWPNQQDNRLAPASASLVGEHFVHGNFVPHIKFSMTAQHDIMKALHVSIQGQSQQDSIRISWNKLSAALGYHVMAIGSDPSGKELVMWTSSETPNVNVSGQFLDTPQVRKYISSKVILPDDRDSCTIPKGIFAATSPPMIMVTSWGVDYWAGYPPRPANAPKDWKPDWSVKGQFLSTAHVMFGMPSRGSEYNSPGNSPDRGTDAPRSRGKSEEVAPNVVKGILRGLF